VRFQPRIGAVGFVFHLLGVASEQITQTVSKQRSAAIPLAGFSKVFAANCEQLHSSRIQHNFELALQELGLPAADVVVIGDDAQADGAGAIAAGCGAILVLSGTHRAGLPAPAGVPIIRSIADLD